MLQRCRLVVPLHEFTHERDRILRTVYPFDARPPCIRIDAVACELKVEVSEAELAQRRTAWKTPAPKATSGVLGKYVRLVKSASEGCVTDQA